MKLFKCRSEKENKELSDMLIDSGNDEVIRLLVMSQSESLLCLKHISEQLAHLTDVIVYLVKIIRPKSIIVPDPTVYGPKINEDFEDGS